MNVLIIDGHPLVHEVLGAVARSVFGDVELRTAKDLEGALAVSRTDPKLDLVLTDLAPGWAGIEALARFRALFPCVPVVVISANDSRAMIRAAFKAGAIGYLPKTLSPKIMVAALQLVAAGGRYVPYEALGDDSPASDKKGNSCVSVPDQLGLTDRQIEVLRLILRGYNNRNIGRELAISEGTVKQHVHAMFCTLGVSSRTEAILAAGRRGLRQE
jgi:DNA-binding NarL/FixJ family response regulator